MCAIFFARLSVLNVETLTPWLAYRAASPELHLLLKIHFISICSKCSGENCSRASMHIIQLDGCFGLVWFGFLKGSVGEL